MEWNDSLSVGFGKIDHDHKELFRMIRELVDAINSHTCKYKIGDVIKFLEDYVGNHFAMEEKLMQELHYPDYPKHKSEHENFIITFAALKQELLRIKDSGSYEGSYELSVKTDQILVDWLLDHIAKVDRKLADFLEKNG